MRVRHLAPIGGLLSWVAVSACHGSTRSSPPAPTPPKLEGVAIGGCVEVVEREGEPFCRVGGDRTLRVVLPAGASDVSLMVGTEAATGAATDESIAIVIPPSATRFEVQARVSGTLRAFTMRLEDAPEAPAWLTLARATMGRGALDDARRAIDAHLAEDADRSERTVAEAEGIRARIAIARADPEAGALLARSAERHAALGEVSRAVDDEAARAWVLGEAMRLEEARTAIARIRSWSRAYPEGEALAAYHEGVLATKLGDVRTSLSALGLAKTRASALGFARLERMATQSYAVMLVAIGRAAEAHAMLTRLAEAGDEAVSACDRAQLDVNRGWVALLAREGEGERLGDGASLLRRGAATYDAECPRAGRRGNALVDLAWAQLQDDDVNGARASLRDARSAAKHLDVEVSLFAIDLEGRIALRVNDPRAALQAYETLRAKAAGVSPDDEARAWEGEAEARAQLGDVAGAIRAAFEADARLDESARAVPLGEGRGAVWSRRARVARKRVALLVRAGRASEALDVARRSRMRLAADAQRGDRVSALTPVARARWEAALAEYRHAHDAIVAESEGDWAASQKGLAKIATARRARDVALRAELDATARALFPESEGPLAPLARGEGVVAIAWQPIDDGWIAFTAEKEGVRAISTKVPAGAELGPALFASIAPALVNARRVRVLAFGASREMDVHALLLDGAPLVDRAIVEYAADPAGPPFDARQGDAVVVADPSGTLSAARREGEEVAAIFEPARTTHLFAAAEASRARVLEALAASGLFHFAGHGSYAGVDGWESALGVANGERVAISDILALSRAPAVVVLSGCETGREGARGGADGIGLGAAFLAAGSHAVIASVRPVSDLTTEPLMRSLAHALAANPNDPAAALREAQRALRHAHPEADWSAFRAMVR